MNSIVILGAKRTALGALLGQFTGVPATQLGATAIKAALEHANLSGERVDEVIMGCVFRLVWVRRLPARPHWLPAFPPKPARPPSIRSAAQA